MSGGLSRLADVLAVEQPSQDTYGTATYLRTDSDGTAWVMLAGSDIETPANGGSTVDAQEGDTVTVRQDGTRLYIMGNGTTPAVGERQVTGMLQPVQEQVEGIVGSVGKAIADSAAAQKVAEAVAAVAEAVAQHFWTDTSGVHVTQVTQDQWEDSEGEGYHSGPNVLINALGQLFRDGLNNLLTMTTEDGARALTIWDGLGNAASNIRAVIGEVITLGKAGESHAEIDYHSLQFIDNEGMTYLHVGDLRDTSGYATYTLNATGNGERVTFTVYGCPSISEIVSATVDGVSDENVTIGPDYPNNVTFQTAPSNGSEVVIVCKSDSAQSKAYTLGVRGASSFGINGLGAMSVAEGIGNVAAGVMSHAEGGHNLAAGRRSHVEGEGSQSTGDDAHAEGIATRAAGIGSHAEGRASQALGQFSHAQNHGTIASGDCQTAIGAWNVNSGDSYALIIGNGTAYNARSNALTVDWDGNATTRSASHAGTERPTSNTPLQKIDSYDSEGESVGYAQIVLTSGGVYRSYAVRNPTTGEAVALYLRALDNGTKQLTLSSGATIADSAIPSLAASKIGSGTLSADRIPTLAIGTKTSGTLARDRGGTGVTAKQASTVTLNNSAATTNHAWHNGVLATVTLGTLHLTSALASGSNRSVGTVPSGYRPSDTVWAVGGTNADASTGKVFIAIASSGAITLYNRSGASLGTGVNMYFTATYAI